MTGKDWNNTPVDNVRERITQSNDIAGIVSEVFGDYLPLTARYEIADALWDAGYRKGK